ncbi:hypothetical protein UlMin_013252 [Ulmus minor]
MTLKEKIGQMTQIERRVANPQLIKDFAIGGMLSATWSGTVPEASCAKWGKMIDVFQRDSDLIERIGAKTAVEVRANGIHCNYALRVAICKDPRWGRCYESYSEDTEIVRNMTSIVTGLQGQPPPGHQKGYPFVQGRNYVAAYAKHFVGDGGTEKGQNEGNTISSYEELERVHMTPYFDCIDKSGSMIMASYSSWNGQRLHARHFLVTEILKNKLGFKGVLISDWRGIDRFSEPKGSEYRKCISIAIKAGIDRLSEPKGSCSARIWPRGKMEFVEHLLYLVEESGEVPMSRIDAAVERILRVKFATGLFEDPYTDKSLQSLLHRDLAGEAIRKSLVLLNNGKNQRPFLPLDGKAKRILITGTHYDNLGFQWGGWTRKWRGLSGNITTDMWCYIFLSGENSELAIPSDSIDLISSAAENIPTLVILISRRPLVLEPWLLEKIDTLIVAWLPGSEGGGGITDLIFRDYDFQGKLPRVWFKSVDQLPTCASDKSYDPLFPLGFGLTKGDTETTPYEKPL